MRNNNWTKLISKPRTDRLKGRHEGLPPSAMNTK